jgi:hypothetical protein
MTNHINEEIRSIRRQLAAKFDNDLGKIFADLRRQGELAKAKSTEPPRRPTNEAGESGSNFEE